VSVRRSSVGSKSPAAGEFFRGVRFPGDLRHSEGVRNPP